MAESTDPAGGAGEGKTFNQADLDRIVQDRLAKEKGKYSDYDELKAKAQRLDEAESANKSEVERLKDENAQLKQAKADSDLKLLRFEVAAEKGIEPDFMVGSTREELEAYADKFLAKYPPAGAGVAGQEPAGGAPAPGPGAPTPPPGGTPKPNLQGGSDPTEGGGDVDIRKVVESIPRG